jgi:hypothetical protein
VVLQGRQLCMHLPQLVQQQQQQQGLQMSMMS